MSAVISINPVMESDLNFLFKIRNNLADLHLWSIRRHPLYSINDFAAEFQNDIRTDKHVFMIIRKGDNPIGFVFSYTPQFIDGYVLVTIYIIKEARLRGIGPLALGKFVIYLFETFNFHKIYLDVYRYNKASLSTLNTFGAHLEGTFKEHRYLNGERHDLYRFAIYDLEKEKIRSIIEKIENRWNK